MMFAFDELYRAADPSFQALDLSVRYTRILLSWKPTVTAQELGAMTNAALGRIPGVGEKGVREIRDALAHYFMPGLRIDPPKETRPEEYARRQAEALERMEAALVEILITMHQT